MLVTQVSLRLADLSLSHSGVPLGSRAQAWSAPAGTCPGEQPLPALPTTGEVSAESTSPRARMPARRQAGGQSAVQQSGLSLRPTRGRQQGGQSKGSQGCWR